MLGDAPNQYSGIDITAMGKGIKKAADKFAPKAAKAQKNFVKGRMKEMRQDANEKLDAKNAEMNARAYSLSKQKVSLKAREDRELAANKESRPARAAQLRKQKAAESNRAKTGRTSMKPVATKSPAKPMQLKSPTQTMAKNASVSSTQVKRPTLSKKPAASKNPPATRRAPMKRGR